jgi:hypothetical protein
MPDTGQILTDAEVGSIPGWPPVGSGWPVLNALIIRGVEAEIIRQGNLQIAGQTYTREPYTIEPPVRHDNVVTHPKDVVLLRHAPVLTLTGFKLEIVSERDATTGEPSIVSDLPRNSYGINLSSGIVRLFYSVPLDPSIFPYPLVNDPAGMWPFAGSFPPGVDNLLATYTSGLATVPADLKLLALMVMARTWKKFQNQDWEVAAMSMSGGAGGSTTYLNVEFTERELGILRRFQRGYFPSSH